MDPTHLRVPGAHDGELHLLEWSTEGVPLLLIHGFGNEAHIWDDFAPSVAPYYRTLALDLRGHGDSDWDADARYALDALVADVEAVARALELERLVLVGHSLGGRVATTFAARHPERMAGLVLVDIGPEVDPRGKLRIQLDIGSRREPVFSSVSEYARALSLAYPAARPHALQRMAQHGLRRLEDGRYGLKMDPVLRGAAGGRRAPGKAREPDDAPERAMWDALASIPCPTLVVRGAASDILSADVADRMVEEALPRGRLAVVPQAGHSVMTDNPDGFRDAVTSFVLE